MEKTLKIKVVGIGGIGTCLVYPLARFFDYDKDHKVTITLIDGDTYEEKNRARQIFAEHGNKAEVTARSLSEAFARVTVKSEAEYITEDSVEYLIEDGDIVLLCVDNHKTRKRLSDKCSYLDNVVLISGGNDYLDGNIQIHIRKDGQDLTLPIANDFHPEIRRPKDKSPDEIGCDEAVESAPQLLITNNMIAALILNALYGYLYHKIKYDEVYVDIKTNNCRAVNRRECQS